MIFTLELTLTKISHGELFFIYFCVGYQLYNYTNTIVKLEILKIIAAYKMY